MAFPESVKDQAFRRSGGRCECHRKHVGVHAPHHGGRCLKRLTKYGAWHAHHIVDTGLDIVSNCEVLCIPCHQLTRTYGR